MDVAKIRVEWDVADETDQRDWALDHAKPLMDEVERLQHIIASQPTAVAEAALERVCDERDQYREALVDANRQLELARRRLMDADTILDELSRHEFTDHGELVAPPGMYYRMWVTCAPCGWEQDISITATPLQRKEVRDTHLAVAIAGRVQ